MKRDLVCASLVSMFMTSVTALAGAEDKKSAVLPGKTITMEVTKDGFVPSRVNIKKGEQVNLVITRKTDETCATDVVIDEYAIDKKLPLNTAVTLSFVPQKTGELKYGCAMKKMVGGVLFVD